MPAASQQQQKLFGLALAVKRGEVSRSNASEEVLDIVDSMSEKKIKDFAGTPHKGLPKKVESVIRKIVRKELMEATAGGEWVAYISTPKGNKLVKTFKSGNEAKSWFKKNSNKLLNTPGVDSIGTMVKSEWDEFEEKWAIESIKSNKKNKSLVKEAKAPDFIITDTPANKIPAMHIPKADVWLGLKMGGELGSGTLTNSHYKLTHKDGKVAAKLSQSGKLAIRVRSEKEPNYLNLIQTTINRIIKQYADKLNLESLRESSNSEPEIITQLRDVMKSGYKTLKDPKSGKRMKVDSYSASAIVKVYDALNYENKKKFGELGLLKMQSVAFKLI